MGKKKKSVMIKKKSKQDRKVESLLNIYIYILKVKTQRKSN